MNGEEREIKFAGTTPVVEGLNVLNDPKCLIKS